MAQKESTLLNLLLELLPGVNLNGFCCPEIQSLLVDVCLNLIHLSLEIDGIFGDKTKEAVKKFQKKEKLQIDGQFGKKSLAKAKIVKK